MKICQNKWLCNSLNFQLYLYRGRPAHLPDDGLLIESEAEDGGEHFEEPSVIVQLSGRVMDGTRCRSGSLDMCIQGKCQVRKEWNFMTYNI